MKTQYFLFILIAPSLLVGCAGQVSAQIINTPSSPVKEESTAAVETVSKDPPASCPLTMPQNPPFVPPAPYSDLRYEGEFWYGSNSLWTTIRYHNVWEALPRNPEGITQKVFWWRGEYDWTDETEPILTVTGERLDAKAPPLKTSEATNAYASDIGSAMIIDVFLPTLGCWKITGKYKDAELSFVVWVAP